MQGAIWVTALAKLDEYVGFIGGGGQADGVVYDVFNSGEVL